MTDRARDPGAIKVERGEIRGSDVLARIHFHAVEDSEEIFPAQAIAQHRLMQRTCDEMAWPARI